MTQLNNETENLISEDDSCIKIYESFEDIVLKYNLLRGI